MKKIMIAILLLSAACPAFALDAERADDLRREKANLTAQYEKKQKEMAEITLKLHEINAQLSEAGTSAKSEEHQSPMRRGY